MNFRAPRVLVVGGGPAGVGVALQLADLGVPALVVEQALEPRERPGECLTPNFRPLLERLRLMDVLVDQPRIQAFVSRWDHGVTVERPLIAEPHGEGWLLDRRRFETQLVAESRRRGVRWQLGWRVERLQRDDEGWQVELSNAQGRRTVRSDFVIDATGRFASVLRKLKVARVANDKFWGSWLVTSSRARFEGAVHIEAGADGWWYAAPLADGRISVVWFSDRAAESATDLLVRARASEAIKAMIGDAPAFSFSVHAAGSARAAQVSGPGWFAVGDAALAFDPLSSYGIGSALGTAYYAAQALLAQWTGDQEASAAYGALLDQQWHAYLEGLIERYDARHPFSDQPFWRTRVRHVQALRAKVNGSPEAPSLGSL